MKLHKMRQRERETRGEYQYAQKNGIPGNQAASSLSGCMAFVDATLYKAAGQPNQEELQEFAGTPDRVSGLTIAPSEFMTMYVSITVIITIITSYLLHAKFLTCAVF